MGLTTLRPGAPLGLARGETAVCVVVASATQPVADCIRRLAEHTPRKVPIVVAAEADGEGSQAERFGEVKRDVYHLAVPAPAGEAALAGAALAACADADVVVLTTHAMVSAGWLERLRAAGRSDTTVATASALGTEVAPVSPGDPEELAQMARRVADASPVARPRIPAPSGHCVWIARAALELIGPLDAEAASVHAAVAGFGQRCVLHGLLNVAADDVFVPSPQPADTRGPSSQEDLSPPLRRSLASARRSLRALSVTVDARIVRGSFSGAHAEALELIETLARNDQVKVRALIDPAIGPDALALLDALPQVERLQAAQTPQDLGRTDVVHRPYQVSSLADLELLPRLGERLVVNHLDLIAFHNPGYFESGASWSRFRRVTRIGLAMADLVIFRSRHAAEDALREGLVEEQRVRVMPMAVNRVPPPPRPRRPSSVPAGLPFLAVVGNDFRHKNRLFAMRLCEELRARGWDGRLLLAGAHVEHGSSRGDEAAYLESRPGLAPFVHDLGPVAHEELAWLYANAAAIAYPSTYEGFGLIPFEAARAGTPCLFAPQASLAEVFPPAAALLQPWSVSESAERVLRLLGSEKEQRRNVEAIAAVANGLPGPQEIAEQLLDAYREAESQPRREAAALAADARERETWVARWSGLESELAEMVGPDGSLPLEDQRALMSVLTRERLRGPFLAALRSVYRAGYRARRTGRSR
jgi:glycosyltransferase involved in cell wall biosynthesis